MQFNKNRHYSMRNLSRTVLAVACLAGLLLLTAGCGGAGSSLAKNPGDGGGVLLSAPPSTALQVWVGAEPADRILSFQLDVSSITLRKSQDVNVSADLLPDASALELTRVAATFEPIAVSNVTPNTYDQLEMVVSGVRVTYLDVNGVVQERDVASNQTSLLTLNPSVVVGDIPTILSIAVDIEQTVQVDPVNNLVTMNPPVLSATQSDIASSSGPSPAGIHARPKTQAMSASNTGKIERLVGQVVSAASDQLSLQLGQSGSVLTLYTDGNTLFENTTPDTVNGMLVEVQGRALTDGTLYASDVAALFPATGVEVEGTLAGNNPSGLLNLVPEDGIGAGMTTALVGAKISVQVDGSTSYQVNFGNEDMTGLPVVFDENHISAAQRIEVESNQALQPDLAGNPAQVQPYLVELLRQTLKGTVQNYQAGDLGTAEFDLVLSQNSYVSLMNVGTGTVHVYQVSTTQLSSAIQNGNSMSVRGFLFCTDPTGKVPPGTTLHFAMAASSINGTD